MIGRIKSGAELVRASTPRRLLGRRSASAFASAAALLVAIAVRPDASIAAEVNAHGASHPVGFADIAAKVKSAVIGVRVKVENAESQLPDQELPFPPGSPFYKFFGTPDQNPQKRRFGTALGSGFFISSDGYAVTNNHVVEHGRNFEVTTDDGKTYPAKVIGTDSKTDVALIKVDGNNDFPYVRFSSTEPSVGDWVLAVGNPFGLGGTVTAGIVSARGRDIGAGSFDDFIQIDAPVNKGNSGGPTFDVQGEVIGVNAAIFSPSGGFIGIAFAIPADTVKLVVEQLKDKGSVTRGWLGVQIQSVTPEIAESLGLKKPEGALVAEPQPGTPAIKAGIKSGDIITSVNDQPVKDSRDLAKKIGGMPPGTSIKLGTLRSGQPKTLTVTLGELPNTPARAESKQQPSERPNAPNEETGLGLSLAPARKVAGAGSLGVVVTQVDPGGHAADSGLEAGDVILEVGGRTVSSPADVRNAVNEARGHSKHTVLLRVKTGQNTRFVAVPIG
jgi:serine protease Do